MDTSLLEMSECASASGEETPRMSTPVPFESEASDEDVMECTDNFSTISENSMSVAVEQRSSSNQDILGTHVQDTKGDECVQYKIVFDNVNKNITPRSQALDRQTVSHNYVHMYAIRDRISSFNLSRVRRVPPLLSREDIAKAILPSPEDDITLKQNFSIMVSRVLVDHLPFFKFTFQDVVQQHIKHKYYKEMSQLSEVVG